MSTYPFIGVRHTHRAEAGLHVVEIHLDAPGLRFQLTQPAGERRYGGQPSISARELAAQVCVNAHFWSRSSAEMEAFLIGLAAAEGRRFSEFEKPRQAYALVADAPGVRVSATNEASLGEAGLRGAIEDGGGGVGAGGDGGAGDDCGVRGRGASGGGPRRGSMGTGVRGTTW